MGGKDMNKLSKQTLYVFEFCIFFHSGTRINLLTFSFPSLTQVKPLIWIESVIERHAHSRVEYMVKAKSQFKRRSTANNVEIIIPVPNDASAPKFKTTIGHCK